jgi:P-type conjugative transfer protein TrbJ
MLAALVALPVLTGTIILPVAPATAQITVFDPGNYTQNLLTAARTLQQVNNQIQSLQNEATMLTNMAKNLKRLDFTSLTQITQSLQQIDTLMTQANGITFDLASTEAALRSEFPATFDTAMTADQMAAHARTQWQAAMDGYRQTMRVQSQVVGNVEADSGLLATLVSQSQAAGGGLEAQQAANQLTALAVKQQFQLQNMMAAQYRADALERARQAEALEAARLTTKRFAGSANIYTRQ